MIARALFWGTLGALAWTHAGYAIAVAALARIRRRDVHRSPVEPSVSIIVAAHDEQATIGRRIANLLALDYPADRFEVVVASDASTDRTEAIVQEAAARDARVRLLRLGRIGKDAALLAASLEARGEILAFSDANTLWAGDALATLTRNFADPEVGYVCGQLRLLSAGGTNREGVYWRYELWLRANESALGSITGGNGAIYAVRKTSYAGRRFGDDIGLPPLIARHGQRAVYDPDALAFENPARDLEDEYRRKARMFACDWKQLLEGNMLRHARPGYLVQLISHRALRYASGFLHIGLLAATVALSRQGRTYRLALAGQLTMVGLALAGRRRVPAPGASLAYYYVLIMWATVAGLVRYLRFGAPVVWDKAPGSR